MDIEITLKNYRCFPDTDPAHFVIHAGEPTAFVGVNNAGKSALIRFFFEFREAFKSGFLRHAALGQMGEGSSNACTLYGVRDSSEVFHTGNDRDLEFTIALSPSDGSPRLAFEVTVRREDNRWHVVPVIGTTRITRIQHVDNDNRVLFANNQDGLVADFSDLVAICTEFGQALYIGPLRNALGITNGPYFDLQVGRDLIGGWRARAASASPRERRWARAFTTTLASLFGYSTLEIDTHPANTTFYLWVDGHTHHLAELGGGFAQAFIVLVNAATQRSPYILIDEPELNLHPALQLRFFAELATYAQRSVLFATHSLGLARSVTSQIYSVRKCGPDRSTVTLFGDSEGLPEMLGELSYGSYHDLGYDKLVLVEGPTELRTMQQFLRELGKDQEVVLLPMGGRGMINPDRVPELQEIKRVARGEQGGVRVLIDSERQTAGAQLEGKRQGFVDACNQVGIPCTVLERRALENYFPVGAIRAVYGPAYRALTPYEKLSEVQPNWSKNENWRIVHEMTRDDVLRAGDLGAFLGTL